MISKDARQKAENQGVLVRMSAEMIARIDDLRRREDDLPTRPEMIRRLVEAQLAQESGARR